MENQEIVIDNNDLYDVDVSNSDIVYVSTSSYEDLKKKPQINSVELLGNKSADDLNLQIKGDYANSRITNIEIEAIFNDW